MDSQSVLGCAMSMNYLQSQSKLSIPEFFQQFGIENIYMAILERTLRTQDFSYSQCEVESRLVLDAGPADIKSRSPLVHCLRVLSCLCPLGS